MNGVSAFVKETHRASYLLSPCKVTVRRQLSLNQAACPQQTLNQLDNTDGGSDPELLIESGKYEKTIFNY